MTTNAVHDPCFDSISFPPGRWLVLEEGDEIKEGDLWADSDWARRKWWVTNRAGFLAGQAGCIYIRAI